MISVPMGQKTLLYGAVALICPLFLFCAASLVKNKTARKVLLFSVSVAYICGIFCLTLAGRSSGQRLINLTPLWTYRLTKDPQYRWQGYMNVFLFIPFGFMLPFAAKQDFKKSFLIGFAFSVCIEVIQYIFRLGMCEFDDVFHNTLGTALGYGYWKLLSWMKAKYGNKIRAIAHGLKSYIQRRRSKERSILKLDRGNKQ